MAVAIPQVRSSNQMSLATLRTFFVATFVLSWGVGMLLSVFPDQAGGLFGRWDTPTRPSF